MICLLLLFCLVSGETATLLFNRVDVVNDIHKHVYIKLYSHSKETALMYTSLLFRSPRRQVVGYGANKSHDHYHNALLIGNHIYQQYYKITKDSLFQYNNEIPLIARGVNFMIPFSVVPSREEWNKIAKTSYTESSSGATLDSIDVYDMMASESSSSSATTSHALLSLDKYSSIWDRYNVLSITPYFVTLRYETDGHVNHQLDEYGGIVQLQCRGRGGGEGMDEHDDRCVVETSILTVGDGTTYNSTGYRLVIDLHSSSNYLPTHLYFHLQSLPPSQRTLLIDSLPINNKYTYMLNAYDNDIILGADLLHLFTKIEYSIETGEINLWYFSETYIHNDRHESVAISMTFLLLIALYCYFEYISSDPGALFQLLVCYSQVTERWFFFYVRGVLVEILILVLSTLFMILTLLFTEYNSTWRCQRTILFGIMTFYHVAVLILVIIVTPQATKKAFAYYFGGKKGKAIMRTVRRLRGEPVIISPIITRTADRDYEIVKEAYLEGDAEEGKLSKELTINVIARKTCLINLIMLSIMMKLNYTSEESYAYLLSLFGVSLAFLYFACHNLVLGWLFWINSNRPPQLSYLLFLCGELICVIFYTAWAIPCLYLDYMYSINSVYTEAFIIAITLILVGFMFIFSFSGYENKIEDLIQAHYVAQ